MFIGLVVPGGQNATDVPLPWSIPWIFADGSESKSLWDALSLGPKDPCAVGLVLFPKAKVEDPPGEKAVGNRFIRNAPNKIQPQGGSSDSLGESGDLERGLAYEPQASQASGLSREQATWARASSLLRMAWVIGVDAGAAGDCMAKVAGVEAAMPWLVAF